MLAISLHGSCAAYKFLRTKCNRDSRRTWSAEKKYARGRLAIERRDQRQDRQIRSSPDLRADPAKIEVVYPAVDPFFQSPAAPEHISSPRSRFGVNRDYILCVGIYKPRKNHVGLLQAFQLLLKHGVQSQLVIAGPMGEGESILRRLAQELRIAQHVVFTGFVHDADLRALYSGARACVCPSLYEGFGFTVLE